MALQPQTDLTHLLPVVFRVCIQGDVDAFLQSPADLPDRNAQKTLGQIRLDIKTFLKSPDDLFQLFCLIPFFYVRNDVDICFLRLPDLAQNTLVKRQIGL